MNAAENTFVTGVGFYSLFLSAGINVSVLTVYKILVLQTFPQLRSRVLLIEQIRASFYSRT